MPKFNIELSFDCRANVTLDTDDYQTVEEVEKAFNHYGMELFYNDPGLADDKISLFSHTIVDIELNNTERNEV